MVTQAPKRSAVLGALAFTLSCLGLMIFVWTQFAGTIPFRPEGYRIHGLFPETGLLVPNADVRIAGVNVGKVANVQAEGVNSLVTLDINRQFAPIPADTQAIVRQKTLLGEAYIELSTGAGTGPKLQDGGAIPSTQIAHTQQLDQVLGSFDQPTQTALQAFLTGTFQSLAGRGQDLNDAIGNLDPAVTELSSVVGVLNQQSGNVQSLINNLGSVLTTLGNRSADLQTLITAGDQVFATTAAGNAALTSTVNSLPAFMAQLRATLTTLNGTLGIAKPSLDALRPVAPLLTPALSDLIKLSTPAVKLLRAAPTLLNDAIRALPAIARFTRAFDPGVKALLGTAEQVVPMINFIGDYSQELTSAMANLAADLEGVSAAPTTNDANSTPSGYAHYLRAIAGPLTSESIYGQSVREPTNRHNGYYSPGEQSHIVGGHLLASDCKNAGNSSQIPLPVGGGNVPCTQQPAFSWGSVAPTTSSSYYPHLTAAAPPSVK